MEDYIPIEELGQPKQEKQQVKSKHIGFLEVMGYLGKSFIFILKLLWFGISRFARGLFLMLQKLSEMMEQTRKSEFGKNLMKQHKQQSFGFGKSGKKQKNPFGWG